MLVDVGTSLSTSFADFETPYQQEKSFDAYSELILADLLCETGDHNGALALLHRFPRTHIREMDLKRVFQLGVALCERVKTIPKLLGAEDMPMISAAFGPLDVLVLPYSLLATPSSHRIDYETFMKKSFMWPWIRRNVQAQLQDQPGEPVYLHPTVLDTQFGDAFGHSILHAAIISQYEQIDAVIDDISGCAQEDVRADLSTAWASYAQGLTPLACSASSLNYEKTMSCFLMYVTIRAGIYVADQALAQPGMNSVRLTVHFETGTMTLRRP